MGGSVSSVILVVEDAELKGGGLFVSPLSTIWSCGALGNASARASARSDLEVVVRGGEGGSVSSLLVLVVEDAELEGRALCLGDFARNDGTSSFRARHSDTRASADLPR